MINVDGGILAAILGVVAAFFYGVFQTKKIDKLKSKNKELAAFAREKDKAIKSMEIWVGSDAKKEEFKRRVHAARDADELHGLLKAATHRNSRDKDSR